MNPEEEAVEVGDSMPSIIEQARLKGWRADIWNFGKAEDSGRDFFNPGLVRRNDGLWLLVRMSEHVEGMPYGRNGIWACKLKEDLSPEGGPLLVFPDSGSAEQFEDPRAVYWNGQTWVGCVNFTWFDDGSWTGAHQCLGIFKNDGMTGQEDARWTPIVRRDPPVGTNLDRSGHTDGKHNKNLLWWFHDGKLHLIYTSDPWHVIEFGSSWDEQTDHKWEGVKWKYGTVRGGTPPVLVGDRYYTFFHSSLPWRGRFRRYHMGAIAFEATPPFKPLVWTHEPLLSGSQNDPWQQRKPLVVFPCGALHENDWWTISMGVNDLKSAWVKIPHEDVVNALKEVPPMPGLALMAAKTVRPDYEHIPFEPNGGDQRGKKENEETQTGQARIPGRQAPVDSVAAPTSNPAVAADRVYMPEMLPPAVRAQFRQPARVLSGSTEGRVSEDATPEQSATSREQVVSENQVSPAQNSPRPRGRPRKDGLAPGSVPPRVKRRYRKRRKKKVLKSET